MGQMGKAVFPLAAGVALGAVAAPMLAAAIPAMAAAGGAAAGGAAMGAETALTGGALGSAVGMGFPAIAETAGAAGAAASPFSLAKLIPSEEALRKANYAANIGQFGGALFGTGQEPLRAPAPSFPSAPGAYRPTATSQMELLQQALARRAQARGGRLFG